MLQKNIIVSKTARYFILGKPSELINEVWIVCHGYGELAPYFLKKFEGLNDGTRLIVAPEALNRFYREGFTGKVGASWMTKEERVSEITDYVNYLQLIYNEIIPSLKNKDLKINVLGFSQATATVCRWLISSKLQVDKLVLWAGFFPHDLNFELDKAYFNAIDCYIMMGSEDEYYTSEVVDAKLEEFRSEKGLKFTFLSFKGKHEISKDALQELIK